MPEEMAEVLESESSVSDAEVSDVAESETADVEATEPAEQDQKETPEEEFDWDNPDPNKLPPEVQKYYKGMQASYTRKMQALSSALEGLRTHSTRLQLLDRAIAGDQQARQQLAQIIQVQQAQAQQADPMADVPEEFQDTKHLVSFFDNRLKRVLDYTLNYINQQLGQQVAPIQQNLFMQQRLAEYHSLKAKYPDFDNYIQQMIEIREQNPGISLEAAYKLATYKPAVPPTKLVSKPGARPSATRPKDSDKPMTWEEAAEAAIRQLKKGR